MNVGFNQFKQKNNQEEQQNKNKITKLGIIGILVLIIGLVGITYAFFNYTRTGTTNTIKVGRISFNSNQTETINLTNVFPIDSSNVDSDTTNVDEAVITITGDTTYTEGIEYLLTATDVSNTVGTGNNQKTVPISIQVTANNGLGNADASYFDNRGDDSSIYKVLAKEKIEDNGQLLVGYITNGQDGINGAVTIKAYLDKDRIGISDTYDGTESEIKGTTTEWADGRTILTTTEWNSLQTNGVSFKVKVEANEGIWVEEPLTGTQMVQRAILAKQEAETNSCNPVWIDDNGTQSDETDDITYFSGTNECVNMNYVWYSGKLWRITAIYPDGTMKLVTQNNITSIAFNASEQVNFYTDSNTTSYMYQWLNEDFYDTLYNANQLIDTSKQWNATMPSDTNVSTKPLETNMVTANVGLLNNYEYYNSYRCISSSTCTGSSYSTGYLNIGYIWWLLNPYNLSYVWSVSDHGWGNNRPINAFGSRPSIVIKSGLEFIGDGTSEIPYRIVGDKDIGQANELINTRLSGEYVKLSNGTTNQVFRIIGIEENKTKIIAMDYADNKNTREFATDSSDVLWGSGTTTGADTWYTYLNTTSIGYFDTLKSTYGELFDSGLYYLGTSGYNYKLSVCANITSGNTKVCDKTNDKGTFNIGLPRYGEMFATQQAGGKSISKDIWLMNRYNATDVWSVTMYGDAINAFPGVKNGARPTVHLKSSVKIISGTGTETDPYVVGISN